ncbi:hypothetical protein [Paraburkholderia guartelaensis]|uniref:Transposase n=1 Tax=Paraburkholderia guartelaensis TaxID=2546446 RepID=A0ABU9SJQ1_9BURK
MDWSGHQQAGLAAAITGGAARKGRSGPYRSFAGDPRTRLAAGHRPQRPSDRLLRLAREGGQTAVYQIEEYETDRRHATLIAILLDTTATLTDEILNLHDRLIGSFFTKAKHKYEKRLAAEGNAVNDKVRLYAKVGAALIAAKDAGDDPFLAQPYGSSAKSTKA